MPDRVPVLTEGRLTFVDSVTYQRMVARHDKLADYVHMQLHNISTARRDCKLCHYLREDGA